MTKSDLIAIVAKKGHLTKKAADEAIEVFLESLGLHNMLNIILVCQIFTPFLIL